MPAATSPDPRPLPRAPRACAGGLLAGVLLAWSSGCASSSGAVPRPFPTPGAAAAPPPAAAPALVADPATVVGSALALQGRPYRDGGADPSGFDCSGLVAYVFARHGVWMPRTAAEQFAVGRGVDESALEPGDLVFFSTVAPGPSHVGIAVSADAFVHAPSDGGVVRIEALAAPYWARRYLGARRVR